MLILFQTDTDKQVSLLILNELLAWMDHFLCWTASSWSQKAGLFFQFVCNAAVNQVSNLIYMMCAYVNSGGDGSDKNG